MEWVTVATMGLEENELVLKAYIESQIANANFELHYAATNAEKHVATLRLNWLHHNLVNLETKVQERKDKGNVISFFRRRA